MNNHFYDVISGTPCDFWPTNNWERAGDGPKYDNEQMIDLFLAVQKACAMPGQTDAQRWQMVMKHLSRLADEYAQHMDGPQAEYQNALVEAGMR